jgi:hypothetical protein
VDETRAKQMLADMLARFSAGSVLHLLSEVLRESAPAELDPDRAESLRDATGTRFVVGIGLDAVWPGCRSRDGTDLKRGSDDEQHEPR